MRTILLVFTATLGIQAGASFIAATSAHAEVYPVCLHSRFDYTDCGYTSFAACAATASGIGASCQINPAYVAYAQDAQSQPAPRRKAKRYYREYQR